MTALCNDCTNAGLCVIRQKLKEDTILEFPDGKIAIVAMETALLSCDHHSPDPLSGDLEELGGGEYDSDGEELWEDSDSVDAPQPSHLYVPESETPVQSSPAPPAVPPGQEVITYGPPGEIGVGPSPAVSSEPRRLRLNLTGM